MKAPTFFMILLSISSLHADDAGMHINLVLRFTLITRLL